jgi:hypothetical protein
MRPALGDDRAVHRGPHDSEKVVSFAVDTFGALH